MTLETGVIFNDVTDAYEARKKMCPVVSSSLGDIELEETSAITQPSLSLRQERGGSLRKSADKPN